MRTLATIALAAAFAFASANAHTTGSVPNPRPGVIVIGDDDGGGIDDHVKFFERLMQSGVPVRVQGICISACTLVLMLPQSQVCFAPTAALGFHLARTGARPEPELTVVLQRRYYPQVVQDWINRWVAARGPLTVDRIVYLSAHDLVAMGGGRWCDKSDSTSRPGVSTPTTPEGE